jgi:hypothetical protein
MRRRSAPSNSSALPRFTARFHTVFRKRGSGFRPYVVVRRKKYMPCFSVAKSFEALIGSEIQG